MKPLLPFLIVMVSCVIASADDEKRPETTAGSFEGTKAGAAKELVPGIKFHWCPAGTFVMGSPKTEIGKSGKHEDDEDQASVTFTSGFWIGETEVTQGQWQRQMGTAPWKGQDCVKVGGDFAASYISHDDAVSFCDKLTTQERSAGRLRKNWRCSLPTEAQWEYACRAGTQTKFSFGDDESKLSEYGWWGALSPEGNVKLELYAHRVGQKQPNAWGLCDMHGNVLEWCSDWNGEKLLGGRDPIGIPEGSYRVVRGGRWGGIAAVCRSADREGFPSEFQNSNLGFRLAVVPE